MKFRYVAPSVYEALDTRALKRASEEWERLRTLGFVREIERAPSVRVEVKRK